MDVENAEPPIGLHAKLYMCEIGWDCRVFIGSANATASAFNHNVELLVELLGRKSKVGIDTLLDAVPGEASFRSLLTRYEPPATPRDSSVERELDKLINVAKQVMVGADWEFHVGHQAPGQFSLALKRHSQSPLAIPADVEIRVWPVTLARPAAARRLDGTEQLVEFPECSLDTLTTFLACEALATYNDVSRTARFVLNVPLRNAPSGRREAVLRFILDHPDKVMRFLQFLLNEGDLDRMAASPAAGARAELGAGAGQEDFVLLESLLRALAHEPERLDEVDRLLQELRDGTDANSRIPAGLLDIWPAIWDARRRVVA